MSRAIFVSLNRLYPELTTTAQQTQSHSLRNTTSVWWRINPESARGVRYAFGVFRGSIVSAYRVEVESDQWPLMPGPSTSEGRRAIPTLELSEEEWEQALAPRAERIVLGQAPVRYGEVSDDGLFTVTLQNLGAP